MNREIPKACSLTQLFTDEPFTNGLEVLSDDFIEPITPTIGGSKTIVLQQLQLIILQGQPINTNEIGDF
jgi:hypothetical protein